MLFRSLPPNTGKPQQQRSGDYRTVDGRKPDNHEDQPEERADGIPEENLRRQEVAAQETETCAGRLVHIARRGSTRMQTRVSSTDRQQPNSGYNTNPQPGERKSIIALHLSANKRSQREQTAVRLNFSR